MLNDFTKLKEFIVLHDPVCGEVEKTETEILEPHPQLIVRLRCRGCGANMEARLDAVNEERGWREEFVTKTARITGQTPERIEALLRTEGGIRWIKAEVGRHPNRESAVLWADYLDLMSRIGQ